MTNALIASDVGHPTASPKRLLVVEDEPYNEHSLRTTIEVAFSRHEADRVARIAHERERARLEQKYSDMTSLARRLRREATRDPLTGLCNRRRLDDIAKREISFGQRDSHAVGFILLDLDRFKQTNDTYGHAAGTRCYAPSPISCDRGSGSTTSRAATAARRSWWWSPAKARPVRLRSPSTCGPASRHST